MANTPATPVSSFTLSVLEVDVIDSLGLRKEDIFKPQRFEAKEGKLAAIYINPKGYIEGTSDRMLIVITPDKNDLAGETGTALAYRKVATGEIDEQGRRINDELQVITWEQAKQLVSKLKKSVTESMGKRF